MLPVKKYVPPVFFHPGLTLKSKLEEMGMSIKEFAVRVSLPIEVIENIISCKEAITASIALAFERITHIPTHMWVEKQKSYEAYLSRKAQADQLEADYAWTKQFPLSQMRTNGWIIYGSSAQSKVEALLSFFQMSTIQAWQDYYLNKCVSVAFRISLKDSQNPYAISAWLREGEIQASRIETTTPFSPTQCRSIIPQLKTLCYEQPSDFAVQLQQLCASVGVKVVYTQSLQKAPINGATRWLNSFPVIQMTDRHKKNDIFWFTFFHELGHILLHGENNIFLEDSVYSQSVISQESEADKFASDTLLSSDAEQEIISLGDFSPKALRGYAKRFNVHPGIIVGRLQHKKVIPYSRDNSLIVPIELFSQKSY